MTTRTVTVQMRGIENGVEWFETGQGRDCQCARCGSSCERVECDACAGEGRTEYDDDDFDIVYRTCADCAGKGGWWQCISLRDWCLANPMPGREGVLAEESAALKSPNSPGGG